MPAIYNIILDGTASISEEDFHKANEQIVKFAELLNARSQTNIGERADMLTVNYFGTHKQYDGTIFINCSDAKKLNVLYYMLHTKEHPKFGATAIYSAIAVAAGEVMLKDEELPGQYLRSIILITDGEDNDSPADIKNKIRQIFPNPKINLFVISVGTSKTSEFEGVADKVIPINDFGSLGAALVITTQILR